MNNKSKILLDVNNNPIKCHGFNEEEKTPCKNFATRYVDTSWWMKAPCCDSLECEKSLRWVLATQQDDGTISTVSLP